MPISTHINFRFPYIFILWAWCNILTYRICMKNGRFNFQAHLRRQQPSKEMDNVGIGEEIGKKNIASMIPHIMPMSSMTCYIMCPVERTNIVHFDWTGHLKDGIPLANLCIMHKAASFHDFLVEIHVHIALKYCSHNKATVILIENIDWNSCAITKCTIHFARRMKPVFERSLWNFRN